jgi:hypothetical protein
LKFNAEGRELDDEMTKPFSVAFKEKDGPAAHW